MKVAIVSSSVPFVGGGARNIVDWLHLELRAAGHEVETVYLPFSDNPDTLIDQLTAYRWVEIEGADRVICLRPPAHLIRHPRKVIWFIHHLRGYYDLWETPYRGFEDDSRHRALRDSLHAIDGTALREATSLFSNSAVVADRLRHFNGVEAEVLFPPIIAPERFRSGAYSDEIVYVSRLEQHKRQHLAIEAMSRTRSDVRLRLVGASQDPAYVLRLRALVADLDLEERVTIEHGWIDEERKIALLSDALAVCYLPFDEDSYGYPTLEAAYARKATISVGDAGGVAEFVRHGQNGLIEAPEPEAVAAAFDRLFDDRGMARSLGDAARDTIDELGISWAHVLDRLLA